jgi:hypothetical protein
MSKGDDMKAKAIRAACCIGILAATSFAGTYQGVTPTPDSFGESQMPSHSSGLVLTAKKKTRTAGTVLIALGALVAISGISESQSHDISSIGGAFDLIFGGGLVLLGEHDTRSVNPQPQLGLSINASRRTLTINYCVCRF